MREKNNCECGRGTLTQGTEDVVRTGVPRWCPPPGTRLVDVFCAWQEDAPSPLDRDGNLIPLVRALDRDGNLVPLFWAVECTLAVHWHVPPVQEDP
eukprot:1175363-Prorocentrum_minimum.AAC.3